nr:SSI family serine proteinase inhibitor [Nocardia transvalensis]
MTNRARRRQWTVAVTPVILVAGAALGPGTAQAGSAEPAPPPRSSVILTVRPVESLVPRVMTLECAAVSTGTHPLARQACADLEAAGGNIRELADFTDPPLCGQDFDPIAARIDGTWEGRPVSDSGVFSNHCVLIATTKSVFDF